MLKREELVVGREYIRDNITRTLLYIGETRVFFRIENGIEATSPIEQALFSWSIKPKPRIKGWVNIYPSYVSFVHPTRIEADDAASGAWASRVACIYIDVEEGEGLECGKEKGDG